MINPVQAKARLARHYRALIEEVEQQQEFQVLDHDWSQIDAVLRYAQAAEDSSHGSLAELVERLNQYWDARGMVQDWVYWSQRAVEACIANHDYRGVSEHVGRLGNAYRYLGQVEQSITCYRHALAIAEDIGDRHWQGVWLGNLGQADRAMEFYEQALALRRETGDRRGEAQDLGNLGSAYYVLGQFEQALSHFQQALTIDREIGNRLGEAQWLTNLGMAHRALDRLEEAVNHYQQALQISRNLGDRWGENHNLGNLGLAYSHLGQVEQALAHYQQALALDRQIGDRRAEGNWLANLGEEMQRALRQPDQALGYYRQALAIRREIGDRRGEAIDLHNLGTLHREQGQLALAIFEEIRSPYAEVSRRLLEEIAAEAVQPDRVDEKGDDEPNVSLK